MREACGSSAATERPPLILFGGLAVWDLIPFWSSQVQSPLLLWRCLVRRLGLQGGHNPGAP
eukprot:4889431-Amphidinium_carterae.1